MEVVSSKVQEEIQGLQGERALLLAQLEKIELSHTKAQAHRVNPPPPPPASQRRLAPWDCISRPSIVVGVDYYPDSVYVW